MASSRRALFGLAAAGILPAQTRVREASGVFRSGPYLLVADDSTAGEYFRLTLPKTPPPLMLLNDLKPQAIPLKQSGVAIDLESIGILADGRVVALSERLRSLVGDEGIIAEYDSLLSEVGKRGLEGLAVRPMPNRASRVAVLWEGGYPETQSLPGRLRRERAEPLLPLILIHDLPARGRAGRVRLRDAVAAIEMHAPQPPGESSAEQRFRAPDLVWTRIGSDWGFILLLSSQDASERPRFLHYWLLRFDLEGRPVGDPIDIQQFAPPAHRGANWEGLAWFEPGKSLLLVHEAGAAPAAAMIIPLPETWRSSSLVP